MDLGNEPCSVGYLTGAHMVLSWTRLCTFRRSTGRVSLPLTKSINTRQKLTKPKRRSPKIRLNVWRWWGEIAEPIADDPG